MSIDLQRVLAEPVLIGAIVAALLAVKFVLLFGVGISAGGLDKRGAFQLATVMSLGGEFAFIVFNEAVKANLLDDPTRDRLIAAVGVSMALTPLLMIAAQRMLDATPAPKDKRPYDDIPDHHPQVLIAGMGRFGQIIARLLVAHRTPFIGIENSAEQVDFMRRFGNMIYYGDPARPELLRSAGAANVKIFVVAIDDRDSGIRTVRTIRRLYPKAKVFARAREGKIEKILDGRSEAPGARAIDLSQHTCTPGWTDLHVHMSSQSSPQSYSEGFRLDDTDFAFRSVGYAKKTLLAGFTSVRDLGGEVAPHLRDAINQGLVDGPRIWAAGKSIATTGGHADPTNGYNDALSHLIGPPGPTEGVINSIDDA
ncbi:NAD-binding protein, partial [Lysobacter sp. 2RAB21]